MELKVFWRTLWQRWYLTLAVLALTIGVTGYIAVRVGPTYEAEGSALVFPPVSSTRTEGTSKTIGNPYLELAGVGQARDVVIRTMKSRTVQTSWGEDFPGMSYEATPDFTNSAPIILFTVEGDTADASVAGLDDLMSRIPLILSELQDGLGLPPDSYVTARALTQDARPETVRKTQIRAGLLTAAVTGGLGLLLLALVDSLLGARARPRPEREPARARARSRSEREPAEPAGEAEPVREAAPAEEAAPAGEAVPAEEAEDVPPAAEVPLREETETGPPAKGGASAEEAEEAEEAVEAEEAEEDRATPPVYVKRVLVDAELAVSPARSRWPGAVSPSQPRANPFRNGDSSPPAAVPGSRPTTKAPGRKK